MSAREPLPSQAAESSSENVATKGAALILEGTPRYCRPRLAFVGTVNRLVQSGPIGNRNETYQGVYWSDR
jgi:hypothetical protein